MSAAPTPPPALAFERVSFTYDGGIRALAAIELAIGAGEAVALCGANGSGKTTLLKLAAGLLAPAAGCVRLAGEALDAASSRRAFHKIGFLFQDSEDQLFCPTVREDIAYGPRNLGLAEAAVAERVAEALQIMHLAALAERPIHHLSAGEKKRTALAGLVAMRVPILVLDEPTAGLDPAGAAELVHYLRLLNARHGYTMLIATHDIGRIPEFAGRIVVLKDGAVFRDGAPAAVLTDIPSLETAALEAPAITQYFYRRRQLGLDAGRPIPLTLEEAFGAMAPPAAERQQTTDHHEGHEDHEAAP